MENNDLNLKLDNLLSNTLLPSDEELKYDTSIQKRKEVNKINANSIKSIEAAKKQGKKNTINKFWEKLTFEQRSKGGKISGKKRTEMTDFHEHLCNMGKKSGKKRIVNGLNNKKAIINSIKNDRFITSELRKACESFGYKSWKSILKESKLVKQIYKGKNQFDPSIYEKIKMGVSDETQPPIYGRKTRETAH